MPPSLIDRLTDAAQRRTQDAGLTSCDFATSKLADALMMTD